MDVTNPIQDRSKNTQIVCPFAMTDSTISVSDKALSNALALLVEDFRLRTKNSTGKNDITTTCTTLDEYDTEAAELESVLSSFTLYVRRKITNVRHRRNVVARRLPPELLRAIFQLRVSDLHLSRLEVASIEQRNAANGEEGLVRIDKWEPKDAPLDTAFSATVKIGMVCSQWYSIVVSTPQLWVYLDTRHTLEAIPLVLERSKDGLLHILCSAGISKVHEREFMKLLVPHVHRVNSFYSYSYYSDTLDWWGRQVPAPLLEHFVIHKNICTNPSYRMLGRFPKLQSLHLPYSCYRFGTKLLSRLTSLSIQPILRGKMFSMEQFEILLMETQNLETIFFNGGRKPSVNLSFPLFSARLPNLRSIHICDFYPELTTALLLSIFPEPDCCPIVRLTGASALHHSISPLLDPIRADSLLILVLRATTWLSTSKPRDRGRWKICGGKELHGVQTKLLEINTHMRLDIVMVSMLYPDSDFTLRSLELLIDVDLNCIGPIPFLAHYPHLEHLTIASPLYMATQTFLSLSTSRPWPCTQLKRLTIKELGDIRPLFEFVQARFGASREALTVPMHRLEILELRYKNHPARVYDSTWHELTSFLAKENIALEMIQID